MKLIKIAFIFPLALCTAVDADQVINDDLIVNQFSLCVGGDCVNGESFGSDTLRLKENNLRIHFDDTSAAADFAANDWRITINESHNGGLNKFSIDDVSGGKTPFTVEAGAPNHSLYVDDSGRIGIGTSTPSAGVQVHIVDGNTPTLRLEQDASSGFTAQTWDVAGNENNFFIRDPNNGSTLPFRILTGAPTNSIYVASSGNVGFGNASPNAPIHVKDADSAQILVENTTGTTAPRDLFRLINKGNTKFEITNLNAPRSWAFAAPDDGSLRFSAQGSGVVEFELDDSGNLTIAGALVQGSDKNIKDNFETVDGSSLLSKLSQLPIMTWNYQKDDPTVRHIGPMAQDFYAAFGFGEDNKHIAPLDVASIALASIISLDEKASSTKEGLKSEISRLKEQNAVLEKRIIKLEQVLDKVGSR